MSVCSHMAHVRAPFSPVAIVVVRPLSRLFLCALSPSQGMSFLANEELCCPICGVIYFTPNSAFSLSCAAQGCQGHLCFDCLQQAVFPGNQIALDDSKCPHCRRVVDSYSYAFFGAHRFVSTLQDRLSASAVEVERLTKSLATTKAQAAESMHRLEEWCEWATATKSAIQAMPSSATLHRTRAFAGPLQADSETRSRRPRQQVELARLQFQPSSERGRHRPEYNG